MMQLMPATAAQLGVHCTVASPKGFAPKLEIIHKAIEISEQTGGSITLMQDPVKAGPVLLAGGCFAAVQGMKVPDLPAVISRLTRQESLFQRRSGAPSGPVMSCHGNSAIS